MLMASAMPRCLRGAPVQTHPDPLDDSFRHARWQWAAALSALLLVLAGSLHFHEERTLQRVNQRLADAIAVRSAVSIASVSIAFDATPGSAPHAQAVAALDGVQPQLGRLAAKADESAQAAATARYVQDTERLRLKLAAPVGAAIAPAGSPLLVELRALDARGNPLADTMQRDVDGVTARLDLAFLIAYGLSALVLGGVIVRTWVVERARAASARQLRESAETSRSMVDALDQGVIIFDDKARVQRANPAAEKLLGRTLAQMQASPLADLNLLDARGQPIARADLPVALALTQGIVQSGVLIGHARPDGQMVRFYVSAVPLRDGQATRSHGVVASLTDVTERQKVAAELALYRTRLEELVQERTHELGAALAARAETESFAQTITDNQPTLLAYIDPAFRLRFANRAYLAWFGKTRDELIGHDLRETLGPDVVRGSGDALERVRRGEALELPNDLVGAGGEVGHFWTHRLPDMRGGEFRGYYFIATNVTDARRSEQRLRELNAALQVADAFARQVADNIPARIAYWDDQMRCGFVNQVHCDWLGISREATLGRTALEIFGPERFSVLEPRIRAALGGVAQHFEREEFDSSGSPVSSLLHYVPDSRDGRVHGFFVLATDVSEARRAEVTLQRLNAELVLARDLAEAATLAKSAFVANISHEIRTPMNAIIGLTHLMRRENPTPIATERLRRVADAARRLMDIINSVLDLSKIESGKLLLEHDVFSVETLLARACALVSGPAREKGLELLIDHGDLPTMLRGDATRLSQALVNLLTNAVKFTERGSVSVFARVLESNGLDLLVRFDVRDTGIGIDPQQIENIFSAFEQVDGSTTRRFGGTGLGLGITRHLARLMGGDAGARSTPGVGSEFWITLRLQAPSDAHADVPDRRLTGLRALLVDDVAQAREISAAMLRQIGLRTDTASSGAQALAAAWAAEAAGDPYAVVVIDAQMPDLDGIETARHLFENTSGDPPACIMVSSSLDDPMREQAFNLGITSLVQKPVSFSTLHDCLIELLVEPSPESHSSMLELVGEQTLRALHEGTHILLAEDNPVNQEFAVTLLELAGLRVDVARTGREAVAKASATRYDLILMDVQMPELDGLQATRLLRAQPATATTPIVAMTANAYAEDRAACLAAGMNDHITKPVDPPALYDTLLRWLARSAAPPTSALDTRRGLPFFAGDRAAYRRALQHFVGLYADGVASLGTCLVAAPSAAAVDALRRDLHAVRGASALIGAQAVADMAALIDADLHAGMLPEPMLTRFAVELAAAVEAARQAAQK